MSTESETAVETPDVPPFEPEEVKAERGPTDPITKHLWRFKRPERVRLLLPFVDHEVKLERWYGRVAANGDETYHGTILAIATTTIGSAADLVIIKTVEGNVWAISTAQIAYVELEQRPKPAKKTAPARARRQQIDAATETAPEAKAVRRRRKTAPGVSDAAA